MSPLPAPIGPGRNPSPRASAPLAAPAARLRRASSSPRRARSIAACLASAFAISVGACGSGDAPEPTPDPTCSGDTLERRGEATYYTSANGDGACMFGPSPDDLLVGAMNALDYEGSRACGACVALSGPDGSVTVRVVDLCPECARGDIDLSPEAFARISPIAAGRVPITWRYVSCDVTGPIGYHFKEGSNAWWLAVQVRNHANRVDSLEVLVDGQYSVVSRADYNFFVVPEGAGSGPFTFRVRDVFGHSLEDSNVAFVGDTSGAGQFPACAAP